MIVWWVHGIPTRDARSQRLPGDGENSCRNVFPRVSLLPGSRLLCTAVPDPRPRGDGGMLRMGPARQTPKGAGKGDPSVAAAGRAGLAASPPPLPVNDFDLLRVRHSGLFPSLRHPARAFAGSCRLDSALGTHFLTGRFLLASLGYFWEQVLHPISFSAIKAGCVCVCAFDLLAMTARLVQ